MAISQLLPEEQNVSQAPTLGMMGGTLGSGGQQRRNVSQKGSGFTNLQQYVTANEGNRNPQIVAQRQKQAETGLSEAQKGFESQAQQAQTGLQGVQGVQQFVGNVLQDPTKSASTPETLKRFTALRTGQENIGSPTDIMNQYNLAKTQLGSQQQDIGTGLQRDVTSNLQDYIRSQRVNPQLATQGENILDRFLTESTARGQQALESARQKASEIQQTAIPTIAGQVETLQSQLGTPSYLSMADIRKAIDRPAQAEQQALSNINKQYLQERMGLNQKSLQNPNYTNLETGTYVSDQINKYNQNKLDIENEINIQNKEIQKLDNAINFENLVINNKNVSAVDKDRAQFNKSNFERQKQERQTAINSQKQNLNSQTAWYNDYITRNKDVLDLYNNYLNNLSKTKSELLTQFDPNQLARINALAKLSGMDYSNLLSQGIS